MLDEYEKALISEILSEIENVKKVCKIEPNDSTDRSLERIEVIANILLK